MGFACSSLALTACIGLIFVWLVPSPKSAYREIKIYLAEQTKATHAAHSPCQWELTDSQVIGKQVTLCQGGVPTSELIAV